MAFIDYMIFVFAGLALISLLVGCIAFIADKFESSKLVDKMFGGEDEEDC